MKMMMRKKDVKKLFDLAQIEEREVELRRKALQNEELEAEQKAKMLEYTIEHLDPSALIAVHQTNHFPQKGRIKPTGHFLLDLFKGAKTQFIIEDLKLKHPRMTVHFTLNYPVSGVASHGQWITWQCKYAVLVPVKDIMNRIVCLNPVDSWVIGELVLPASAEILIREDEYKANPKSWDILAGKAMVIPFPLNSTLVEAIITRIKMKGYKDTIGHDHGWYEYDDLLYIERFIRRSRFLAHDEQDRLIALAVSKGYQTWNNIFWAMAEKFKKMTMPHFHTLWREIETFSNDVYGAIFDPSSREEKMLASEMKHKLEAFAGEAGEYQQKVLAVIKEREFESSEEKLSLNMLVDELHKNREWIISLIQKIDRLGAEMSWKQFLEQQKIREG